MAVLTREHSNKVTYTVTSRGNNLAVTHMLALVLGVFAEIPCNGIICKSQL